MNTKTRGGGSKVCKIVCPAACRNCDKTPCTDRMADEETPRRLHVAAAQAVGMTKTELQEFWKGNRASGSNAPSPYEDETHRCTIRRPAACRDCGLDCDERMADDQTEKIKGMQALKHCGMRSDLSCRICHDDTCRVRMSKRTF